MLLVFAEKNTPRLIYTLDLVFVQLLKTPYTLLTNWDEFEKSEGLRLNYSNRNSQNVPVIVPDGILFESGISEKEIGHLVHQEVTCLFPVSGGSLPFDPFAAIFYLVVRYEEYLPSQKDKYHRFRPSNSLSFKLGILEKAVVHDYAAMIAQILPGLSLPRRTFKLVNTFDIDMAWSFKHKGFLRNMTSIIRDLAGFHFKSIRQRMSVVLRFKQDPFDTYQYILDTDQEKSLKSLFFVLLGDYGRHDKNIEHTNTEFRKLIQKLSETNPVGLHLSYGVHHEGRQMEIELHRLEHIISQPVSENRFHYLRFSLPDTLLKLRKTGISRDYSMGFASKPGFRAGIACPFFFYDLVSEKATDLTIVPFVCMDATMQYYLKLNPENAAKTYIRLADEVARVGGEFTMIWHNNSLSELKEWKGWRAVYETVIDHCKILETRYPAAQNHSQKTA